MGANESKRTRSGVDVSFLMVEESHASDVPVLFSPRSSRAVCAGVGRHVNMRRKPSDIQACDADARLMYEILERKLSIPQENITILNSSSDSHYTATVCNVEDSLTLAVDNIGPDGILLFYFSGHAIQYEGGSKVALVAADFVDDQRQLITAETLVKSLSGLKERNSELVLIFDCCFAAHLAQDLSAIMATLGFKVSAIASCTEIENSLCYGTLDASFFTYFMHDFMIRMKLFSSGILPIGSISEHCQPLCNAMATLLLKRDGARQLVNASMHPTVITNQYTVTSVMDETDGRRSPPSVPISKTLQRLYQPPTGSARDKEWLEKVSIWLQTEAKRSLKVLQKDDYLMQQKLLETVCCLLIRSVAMLTAADQPELARKPNTFIRSYVQIFEVIMSIEPSAIRTPDYYMEILTLTYYMKGVAEYLPVTYAEMGKLYNLYTALSEDQNETDGEVSQRSAVKDLQQFLNHQTVGIELL